MIIQKKKKTEKKKEYSQLFTTQNSFHFTLSSILKMVGLPKEQQRSSFKEISLHFDQIQNSLLF